MGRRLSYSTPVLISGLLAALALTVRAGQESGGTSEVQLAAACGDVTEVTLSASATTIPAMATPSGTCSAPDAVLPILISADVRDGGGLPVEGCSVMFLVEFGAACSRGFGELCRASNVVLSDAAGVAQIGFSVTQRDLDFCNCMANAAGCPLCPPAATCWPECTPGEDLWCEVVIRAAAGEVRSSDSLVIEYER